MRTDYKILLVLLIVAVLFSFCTPKTNAMPAQPTESVVDNEAESCESSFNYERATEQVVIWVCEVVKQELTQPVEEPEEPETSLLSKILAEVCRNMKNN